MGYVGEVVSWGVSTGVMRSCVGVCVMLVWPGIGGDIMVVDRGSNPWSVL